MRGVRQASCDVIDTVRAARHCFLHRLRPWLPWNLVVHHLDAKNKDLLIR